MNATETLIDERTAEKALKDFRDSLSKESVACGLMPFTKVTIRPGFISGTWFLIVEGPKLWTNIQVTLTPLIYIRRPEYWKIEVVGCMSGFGLPMVGTYTAVIPLDGVIGTKGIEVVGALKSEKHLVPPVH